MKEYISQVPSDHQSQEPLLDVQLEAEAEDKLESATPLRQNQRPWRIRHGTQLILGTVLLILNLLFCISYTKWVDSWYSGCQRKLITPAREIIEFERRQFDTREVYFKNDTFNAAKPPFNGPPTSELAAEWRNLVQNQNIRLQKDQLGPFAADANTESLVALSDGSGYLTTLAVYHGLHCLKRFHHYLYRDHYYPNISEADNKTLLYHTEHCLDWLRQYVQCNADTTLVPFYWGTNQKSPLYVDIGKHQCVKWDPLDQWMNQHSFDAFEPGLLSHPVYGDPYGPNFKDKIGISVEEHILHVEHDQLN